MTFKEITLFELYLGQLHELSKVLGLNAQHDWLRFKLIYTLLTYESLNHPVGIPYCGLSYINNDGIPFQFSLSLGASGCNDLRFICEAGKPHSPIAKRMVDSVNLSRRLLTLMGAGPAWQNLEMVFKHVLPEKNEIPQFWRSAVWFAMGFRPGQCMAKIYMNINRGDIIYRWKLVGSLLKKTGRYQSLEALCEFSRIISNGSLPVGLAVDVLPTGTLGRIKMYFRSLNTDRDYVARWATVAKENHSQYEITRFLDSFSLYQKKFSEGTFIPSLEFAPEDGKNKWYPECKIDVDLAKTGCSSDKQAYASICRLCTFLQIPSSAYQQCIKKLSPSSGLSSQSLELHRVAGVGFDRDGSCHVNIYTGLHSLRKNSSARNKTRKRARRHYSSNVKNISKAIRRATRFLIDIQHNDGYWSDFNLPVGNADEWVTAYTGYQLCRILHIVPAELHTSTIRACKWISQHEHLQGGWGYNNNIETDADSTAWALAFMCLAQCPPSRQSVQRLISFIRPDGGFATYDTDLSYGYWGASCTDVSAVALKALLASAPANISEILLKCKNYLLDCQNENGSWNSYWWASPAYATSAALRILSEMNICPRNDPKRFLQTYTPDGAFEEALILESLVRLRTPIGSTADLLENLLSGQHEDGSWESGAILRLSNQCCREPWQFVNSGLFFKDNKSVFTTATVLGTLNFYLQNYRNQALKKEWHETGSIYCTLLS